jgi:hypothetical protein
MKQTIEIDVNSFKEVVPEYNKNIMFHAKIRKNLNAANIWLQGCVIDYSYDWSCDKWCVQCLSGEIYYMNEVDFWYYVPDVKIS